jgi:hypothetical protein
MAKVAELMTRLKVKNSYAYSGPHLHAVQNNTIGMNDDKVDISRREIIRIVNNAKKKKKE